MVGDNTDIKSHRKPMEECAKQKAGITRLVLRQKNKQRKKVQKPVSTPNMLAKILNSNNNSRRWYVVV